MVSKYSILGEFVDISNVFYSVCTVAIIAKSDFLIRSHIHIISLGSMLCPDVSFIGWYTYVDPNVLPEGVQRKLGCRDRELMQSSTTTDPGYQCESYKLTVRHLKQEQRGQLFPSR